MKTLSSAKETLSEITDASKKVGAAAELQTVALIAVTVVAVAALALSVVALLSQE